MKTVIPDEDLIIHILNNLPKEYLSVVKQLEEGIETLTLEKVRDRLRMKFQRLKQESEEPGTEETALIAQPKGKFKGRCGNCGKFGHKRADCWHRNGIKPPDKQS